MLALDSTGIAEKWRATEMMILRWPIRAGKLFSPLMISQILFADNFNAILLFCFFLQARCSFTGRWHLNFTAPVNWIFNSTFVSVSFHLQIIYAWAKDAPKLELPDGVGFKVGSSSPIKYIVLQVHYAHIEKFKDGSTDDSGIFIHYTKQP